MTTTYDHTNVFAKILRGELPVTKIYEDETALAFPTIEPKAPIHIIVIPKGSYTDYFDFMSHASNTEIIGFNRALAIITEKNGLHKNGCRLISNFGSHGGQEVPHFHIHLLGGKPLSKAITAED